MTDPLDTLIDYAVYVPLGAALTIRDLVPSLIEQGRQRGEQHVAVARVVGKFAVGMGRSKLVKEWSAFVERTSVQRPASSSNERAGAAHATDQSVDGAAGEEPPSVLAADVGEARAAGAGDRVETLAIHEYGFLAASQIVARLAGLSEAERSVIETYERTHRNRRTVLGRIQQLRSGDHPT